MVLCIAYIHVVGTGLPIKGIVKTRGTCFNPQRQESSYQQRTSKQDKEDQQLKQNAATISGRGMMHSHLLFFLILDSQFTVIAHPYHQG